jgi:hypothetical protein
MESLNTTNFFSLIMPFLVKGMDLTLTMRAQDDKITIGVRPNHSGVKDETFRSIPAFMLTHPVAALDESFFTTIAAPMNNVQTLAEAMQAWEGKFNVVKAEAEKKMEGKPKSESKPAAVSSKKTPVKKTVSKPAAAKKKAAPAKPATPKKSAKELQAEKNAKLVEGYKKATETATAFLKEGKYDEALKEAQRLLRMPTTAGSLKDSQAFVKQIKDDKLTAKTLLVMKDYKSLDQTVPEFEKTELPRIKKAVKGLMGIDSQHQDVKDLWAQIQKDDEDRRQSQISAAMDKFIDQAHAMIKGQEFGNALKVLKEVKNQDPDNAKLKEIIEELEPKLGKEFIANAFKTK